MTVPFATKKYLGWYFSLLHQKQFWFNKEQNRLGQCVPLLVLFKGITIQGLNIQFLVFLLFCFGFKTEKQVPCQSIQTKDTNKHCLEINNEMPLKEWSLDAHVCQCSTNKFILFTVMFTVIFESLYKLVTNSWPINISTVSNIYNFYSSYLL